MSTTQDTSSSYECDYSDCEHTFGPGEATAGSFCSQACHHRHRGSKLLNNVRHNHCYCSNCGAQLKEIEKPTDEALKQISGFHSTTCVVGFQYKTPSADKGEVDVKTDVMGRETIATGTVCGECGNANPRDEFPESQDLHLLEFGQRIVDSLVEQREEGVHDKRIHQDTFFDALLGTGELARSLGRALE